MSASLDAGGPLPPPGPAGGEAFDFDDAFGHDLILGFRIGHDRLLIRAGLNGTRIACAADVARCVAADPDGHAVIRLGADSVTLQGLPAAEVIARIGQIVVIT